MKKKLLCVILSVIMLTTSFSGVYASEEAAGVIKTQSAQTLVAETEKVPNEDYVTANAENKIITAQDVMPEVGESYEETDLTQTVTNENILMPPGFSDLAEETDEASETAEAETANELTGITHEEKLALLREKITDDEVYNRVVNGQYIAPTEEEKALSDEGIQKAKENAERIKAEGAKTEDALSYEGGMNKVSELRGKETAKAQTLTPRKGTRIKTIAAGDEFGIQTFSVASLTETEEENSEYIPPMYESPYNMYNNGNEAVSMQNGSLTYTYPVLSLPGKDGFDLNITLTYNSEDFGRGMYKIAKNWSLKLPSIGEYVFYTNGGYNYRYITLRDGRTVIQEKNGEFYGKYIDDFEILRAQAPDSSGVSYDSIKYKDGSVDYFGSWGEILYSADAYGNYIKYEYVEEYNMPARPYSITDSYGRKIVFNYLGNYSYPNGLEIKCGDKVYAAIDMNYVNGSVNKIGTEKLSDGTIANATEFIYEEAVKDNVSSGDGLYGSLLTQINYYTGGCTKFEYEEYWKNIYTARYETYFEAGSEQPHQYNTGYEFFDVRCFRVVSRADYLTTEETAEPKNVVNYYYMTNEDMEYNIFTNDYNNTNYVYYTIVETEDDRNVNGSTQQSIYAFNYRREKIMESVAGSETREFLTADEFNALNLNLTFSENETVDYFANLEYDKHYHCFTKQTTYNSVVYEPGIYELGSGLLLKYQSEFNDNYYARSYGADDENSVIYIKHVNGSKVFYEKISTYFEENLQRDVTEYTYHTDYRLPTKTTQKYRYDNSGNPLYSENSYAANGDVLTSRAENGNIITYTYPETSNGIPITITYSYPGTTNTMVVSNTLAAFGNGAYIEETTTTYRDNTQWKEDYFYTFNQNPSSVYRTDYYSKKTSATLSFIKSIGVDTLINTDTITITTTQYNGDTSADYISISQSFDFNTGLLLNETDAEGLTTTYTYRSDFFDKPDTITAPDGDTTKYVYNIGAENSLITIFNNKYYTKDIMDGLGRRISAYDGEYINEGYGTPRLLGTYTYSDNQNNISCSTDGLGNSTYYYYNDLYNRVTSTLQYSGSENIINRVEYDDINRRKTVYNPEDEYIIYEYDINGNLVKKYTYLDEAQTDLWQESYTYDVYGNMLTQTDANGNTTTYTYDGQNRVSTCKNALNETTSYSYDDLGNLVKITYPNNKAVEYTYDLYGNMTKFTNQLGQYETYTYDNSGNVKTYRNLSGKTTIYTYNYELEDGEKNYLIKYSLTDSATNKRQGVKYEYDVFGNKVRECHISQSYSNDMWQEPVENYRSVYTYTYTFDNRLESETKVNHEGFDNRTITYTYDVNGNITKAVTQFGDVYNYVYDSLGRCTEIVGVESYYYNKDSTLNYSHMLDYVYYVYYEYDRLNRPVSKFVEYADDDYYINSYTYDDAGNILSDLESVGNLYTDEKSYPNLKYYTYDKLNRIKKETDNGKNINYTYDSVGNITYKDYSYASSADVKIEYEGTLRTYEDYVAISHYEYFTYDNANKLTSSYTELWYTDPVEWLDNCSIFPYTYTYDANGNLIKKQTNSKSETYTYNNLNQMTNYTDWDNQVMCYTYMPNGLRESKYDPCYIDNMGTLPFVYYYYMNGKIVNESYSFYSGECLTASNVWGLNGLISRTNYSKEDPETKNTQTSETGLALTDMHGDVVMMTTSDDVDTIVWRSVYNAYGDTTEHSGTFENPFGYCGEYTDEESGLIYLRARMYDPSVGRFISEDPIKDGTNWYAYCNGNPLKYVDPWGLAVTAEDEEYFTTGEIQLMKQYTAEYEKAQENNDYAGMNEAHKKAVALRQANYVYEDYYDYTHGGKIYEYEYEYNEFQMAVHGGQGRTDRVKGSVYIITNKEIIGNQSISKNDFIVYDNRNSINPNMQVRNSYKATKNQIIAVVNILVNYEAEYPSNWNRDQDKNSMIREWDWHNMAYDSHIKRSSTQHVDLDNDDAGKFPWY